MKERTTRRLLVCVGWLALTTISILALPLSSASATTLTPQNSGLCLSIVQGASELLDGARIEQRACNGASRQNWTLEDMGGGQFRAKVLSSGKCLEPLADPPVNGTGLQQSTCNGTARQLWTRQSTALEGTFRFVHSGGRCTDVPAQSTAEGVFVNLWACWPDVRPHQTLAIAQRAIAKHSLRCLDVRGGPQATQDGAVIDQWQCNDGAWNQFWTLRDAGNNQVKLVAQNSGKCIQPLNGGVDNLTPLVQMTCSDTATTQLWSLQSTATLGEYKLVHSLSDKCIDIKQSIMTDGADALLFTCKTANEANQTFAIGTGTPAPPTIETNPPLNGEYWLLPTRYPAKSENGGLHQIFGKAVRWSPIIDMVFLGGYWRDLNPTDGQYDRTRFEVGNGTFYGLNELAAQGKTGIIWTNAVGYDANRDVLHSPDWLLTKCGSSQVVTIPNGSQPWGVSVWNDCPRTEIVKYITTMFTPYRNDPALKYAYVTTFNAGEFFIPDSIYNWAKANAGLTPQKLETYAKAVIDAYVTAVGADKVVWTRANDAWLLPESDPFLAQTPSRVNNYALITKGVQMREGNAENIMANLIQPLIGQDVEPTIFDDAVTSGGQRHWYLKAKTVQTMLPTPRTFYGDEFEIADKAGAPWFDKPPPGSPPNTPDIFVPGNYNYYRLAVLNMLRKGQNWTMFPKELRDGAFDLDSRFVEYIPLRNYFRQSAGFPINVAPDAWALLHMTNDSCFNGRRHYHNYEKFLYQREVPASGSTPGGITKETEPYSWPAGTNGFCLPATTQFARRTDFASNNDFIYFDVDTAFAAPSEHRFRIAVTYKDTGTTSWRIDYNSIARADAPTPSVTNTATNTVKTVIFNLSDAQFQNALPGAMDFRIWNGGGNADVVIRSVRVIRGGS